MLLVAIICIVTACDTTLPVAQNQPTMPADSASIDARVTELMANMSLVDKVGEMTQFSIDVLSVGQPYNLAEPHRLDTAKLRKVLLDLRVGSILNVGGHAYTVEHWHEIIRTIQDIATKRKPTGIPVLYGIDAVHGANYTLGATLFPQQIGLAATWNPRLAYETGRITAYETRASWIPWTFSPVHDIGRDPRWPRMWETFGEDVLLAGRMGEEMVRGYQGDDLSDPYRVAACMKHFLGYSTPWTGKDRTPAYLPERQLQEYFVPPFQAAVDAGAATIMINSGEINGIPVHINEWVLKTLLREQMGFEGLAVTDWEDILLLVSRHRVAKDHKEAIKLAINAGIDMSMVPMDLSFPVLLRELVEEGAVPMSRIDEAVGRILRLKVRLGLFENPYPKVDYPLFAGEQHAAAARRAAQESITLLKNDNKLLPLAKSRKVLVTGPTANSLNYLNGGWTGSWQGADPRWNTPGKLTIVEAIRREIGEGRVTFVAGSEIEKSLDVQAAAQAAKGAEVAIICLGESTYTEKPGDLDEMDLPTAQIELVKAIAATGVPIVLVLAEGRPRIIREIEPLASAIVLAYLPGDEGAPAIADILFGDVNPSGKLPYTYPRYANALLTYDHKGTETIATTFGTDAFRPQYPFGHGLSYTTFRYDNLQLSGAPLRADGRLTVSVDVTNSGSHAGMEVVQLYVTDKVASITPSVKRLRGFEKIELQPGEKKTVSFTLTPRDLAFIGMDHSWVTEAGEFEVEIAGKKQSFFYE